MNFTADDGTVGRVDLYDFNALPVAMGDEVRLDLAVAYRSMNFTADDGTVGRVDLYDFNALPACCLTRECYRNFSTWDPLQSTPFPVVHWVRSNFRQFQRKEEW